MVSREMIADSIELMITAHALDAMVLLTNCDKITPGMLMAAGRLNIPAIVVSGGPMEAGCFQGRQVCYTDLIEAEGSVEKGEMSHEELARFERAANPGAGSCAMMGTANTMNMLTEALGMTLTDGALIPATYGARIALARQAGRQIMALHRENILPRDIMTLEAFENAIAVDMAIGGSTNTCLHLPAIAHEVGIELTMDRFARDRGADPAPRSAQTGGQVLCAGHVRGRRHSGADERDDRTRPDPSRLHDRHGRSDRRKRGRPRDRRTRTSSTR